MTEELRQRVKKVKDLMSKATPGPWLPFIKGSTYAIQTEDRKSEIIQWMGFDSSGFPRITQRANVRLIVAMHTTVPDLVSEVERLEKENERLKKDNARLRENNMTAKSLIADLRAKEG